MKDLINAKTEPHRDSPLGRVLAEERARGIRERIPRQQRNRPRASWMLWGLIIIQMLAFILALSIIRSTVPDGDMASQLNAIPISLETVSLQPIQPDNDTRRLEPLPPEQARDTLHFNRTGIRLRGAEMTQGIQVFNEPENPRCNPDPNADNYIFCNNSIPLVAGRHTMLRVFFACDGNCPMHDSTIRLRVFKDGLERATLTQHLSAGKLLEWNHEPLSKLRSHLDHSLNFEFMPAPKWLSGPLTFELEAMPVTVRVNQSAPQLTALASVTHTFEKRKPLRIAYVPIQYQGKTPQPADDVSYWLTRMVPTHEVDYYRLPVPDIVWEGELDKNALLQKLLYTYWLYAVYHPFDKWPDQLFGWLPQEHYNGGASDPFWCPTCAGPHSSRVAFGGVRPELDIGGPRILVHEIAHNLGAQHAWSPTQAQDAACFRGEGVDIQVDPLWPYNETPYIQEVGVDLYSDPPTVYSASHYDMMAYCAAPWISPHTYRMLFNSPFLQPTPEALPLANYRPQVETATTGALFISGEIYPDGRVSEPEVTYIDGQAAASAASGFAPPSKGDYCLTVEDRETHQLAEHCFEAGFIDVETGLPTAESSSFFATIPHIPAGLATKISLHHQGELLTTIEASKNAPQVTLTYPISQTVLDGQQTIKWHGHDADGDALFYDLLYSPDAGQSWLPLAVRLAETHYTFHTRQLAPSEQAMIQIIASDGFHTSRTESASTFSLNAPPANSISLQGPVAVDMGQTFEVQVVANNLTQTLNSAAFALNFDPTHFIFDGVSSHSGFIAKQSPSDSQPGLINLEIHPDAAAEAFGTDESDVVLATVSLKAIGSSTETQLFLSDFEAQTDPEKRFPISEIWELSLQIGSP